MSPNDGINNMADEDESRRFATVNNDELKRILYEKDSKNTRRSTETAVRTFRTNLKETFHFPMNVFFLFNLNMHY